MVKNRKKIINFLRGQLDPNKYDIKYVYKSLMIYAKKDKFEVFLALQKYIYDSLERKDRDPYYVSSITNVWLRYVKEVLGIATI